MNKRTMGLSLTVTDEEARAIRHQLVDPDYRVNRPPTSDQASLQEIRGWAKKVLAAALLQARIRYQDDERLYTEKRTAEANAQRPTLPRQKGDRPIHGRKEKGGQG